MSDTNRVELSYITETSVWGTTPSAVCTTARYTGESLKQTTNTTQSQEIRADRNIADLLRVGLQGDGGLNVELSYPGTSGFMFDMLRGSLMSSAWSAATTPTVGNITVASVSGTTATVTRTTGSWIADTGQAGVITTNAGVWIKFNSGVTGVNLLPAKVLTISSATVAVISFSGTPVAEGPVAATMSVGSYIRNGTAVPTPVASANNSFTLEKYFQDLTTEFEVIKGAMVDKFSINVAADQIATGTFDFLAKNVVSAAGTGAGTSTTHTAAGTAPVYSGVDNVLAVTVNNSTAITLTGVTAQIQNNLRARLEIGQLGATSVGAGSAAVTGTVAAYYSDATTAVMDRYLNGTVDAMCIVFKDTTPNYWVIDFPKIKYTSGQRVAGGINSDVMLEMAFQALYGSATEAWTVSFTKF